MTISKDHKHLNTLAELNAGLAALTPSLGPLTLDTMRAVAPGATAAMLEAAIAADHNGLYDDIPWADVIAFYTHDLRNRVNSTRPKYEYDKHGDNHFPGGGSGTKFTATQKVVNPTIESLITPEIGRIRRDANGQKVTYYYMTRVSTYCNHGNEITIQLTYDPAKDEVEYHGYPDTPVSGPPKIARNKSGPNIPS